MDLNKPYAVLVKHTNSHPFQPRRFSLDNAVKIGRMAAKCKPSDNNAIFDCKVLSRTHALLSYTNGKFMLCDTGSSNGTFVNKVLLAKPGKDEQEGAMFPVYSGDIVQFGVNVIENPRQMTHHCIIAKMELVNADGTEYIQNDSPTDLVSVNQNGHSIISCHDLYKLGQLIEDAKNREELLEKKLTCLQSLLRHTKEATETTWQAQIHEDSLLTKIEFLETQLLLFKKNQTEDTLINELENLQNDKSRFEQLSKEQIKKIVEEKIETKLELVNTSRDLTEKDEQLNTLNQQYNKSQNDILDLAKKYDQLVEDKHQTQLKFEEVTQNTLNKDEEFKLCEKKYKDEISNEQKNNNSLLAKIESLYVIIDINNAQIEDMAEKLKHGKGIKSGNKGKKSSSVSSGNDQLEIKNMSLQELSRMSCGDDEINDFEDDSDDDGDGDGDGDDDGDGDNAPCDDNHDNDSDSDDSDQCDGDNFLQDVPPCRAMDGQELEVQEPAAAAAEGVEASGDREEFYCQDGRLWLKCVRGTRSFAMPSNCRQVGGDATTEHSGDQRVTCDLARNDGDGSASGGRGAVGPASVVNGGGFGGGGEGGGEAEASSSDEDNTVKCTSATNGVATSSPPLTATPCSSSSPSSSSSSPSSSSTPSTTLNTSSNSDYVQMTNGLVDIDSDSEIDEDDVTSTTSCSSTATLCSSNSTTTTSTATLCSSNSTTSSPSVATHSSRVANECSASSDQAGSPPLLDFNTSSTESEQSTPPKSSHQVSPSLAGQDNSPSPHSPAEDGKPRESEQNSENSLDKLKETSTTRKMPMLSIEEIQHQKLYQTLIAANKMLNDTEERLSRELRELRQSRNNDKEITVDTTDTVDKEDTDDKEEIVDDSLSTQLKVVNEENILLKEKLSNYDDLEITNESQQAEDSAVFDDLYEELAYKVDIIGFFSILPLLTICLAIFFAVSPFLRWFTLTTDT